MTNIKRFLKEPTEEQIKNRLINFDPYTRFHTTAICGYLDIFKDVLKHSTPSQFELTRNKIENAFINAAFYERYNIIEFLNERNFPISEMFKVQFTASHHNFIFYFSHEMQDFLIKYLKKRPSKKFLKTALIRSNYRLLKKIIDRFPSTANIIFDLVFIDFNKPAAPRIIYYIIENYSHKIFYDKLEKAYKNTKMMKIYYDKNSIRKVLKNVMNFKMNK